MAMKMSCFTPPGEPSSVRHGFSTQCTPVHYGTRSRSSSLGATSSAAAARAISTAKGPHVQDSEEEEDEEEEEGDVCRICRNRGDEDHPLRYPCACSGSIKFVHQDCLLQWLDHSNSRQCEVKTGAPSPALPRSRGAPLRC